MQMLQPIAGSIQHYLARSPIQIATVQTIARNAQPNDL